MSDHTKSTLVPSLITERLAMFVWADHEIAVVLERFALMCVSVCYTAVGLLYHRFFNKMKTGSVYSSILFPF